MPTAIVQKSTFSPLEYRNGKIYVSVTMDGQTRSEYFFDTGASLFPLITTQEEWERLTRRRFDDPRNHRYTLPSWNDTWLETVGAPMTGRLKMGPVSSQRPMVFFINDGRFRIDQMPKTRGIIGNALLVREYAIVIDLPGRRMGFIRSADLVPNQPPPVAGVTLLMVFLLSTVMRMAKEASVTDHVWSIEEIIALII